MKKLFGKICVGLIVITSAVMLVGCVNNGPEDPGFLPNAVSVHVRSEYRERVFKVEDFQEVEALSLHIFVSPNHTSIIVYLSQHCYQNVLDAIKIIETFYFVESASPMYIAFPEN